ncbi:MAG TPA: hypothetical protein VLQ66_03445 [Paenisporosarcina sp.]|nr:hypothetical protein [Paenisporosarcina sp.]
MYKELPTTVKSNITRSISNAFQQYMASIKWSEKKFKIEDFISEWRNNVSESAFWKEKISEECKHNPEFHEEVANKINQVIDKILNEPPSEVQVAKIEIMQEECNTHYDYACKAEAVYVESLLKEKQKA